MGSLPVVFEGMKKNCGEGDKVILSTLFLL